MGLNIRGGAGDALYRLTHEIRYGHGYGYTHGDGDGDGRGDGTGDGYSSGSGFKGAFPATLVAAGNTFDSIVLNAMEEIRC
jgi:hypothetical protein